MIVGIPKEIKPNETRVSILPKNVEVLRKAGHSVLVQRDAGTLSGIDDEQYVCAGATMVSSLREIYESAEAVVKVKEPLPEEYSLLRPDQLLMAYLHLTEGKKPELLGALVESEIIAFAYETITLDDGSRPLLAPMSDIAGKVGMLMSVPCLTSPEGRKVLLTEVLGGERCRVTVLGAGVVGLAAANTAAALGAAVRIFEISAAQIEKARKSMPPEVSVFAADIDTVREAAKESDVVVNAIFYSRDTCPDPLIDRETVADMKMGSVIVDISCDEGGAIETAKQMTIENPTYVVDGVIHYCVPNLPAMVARTSTPVLATAIWPYVWAVVDKGWRRAWADDSQLGQGFNLVRGKVVNPAVAQVQGERLESPGPLLCSK